MLRYPQKSSPFMEPEGTVSWTHDLTKMIIFYSKEQLAPNQSPSWRTILHHMSVLFIRYICSYPPYLKAIFSIQNLWMCHGYVQITLINKGSPYQNDAHSMKYLTHDVLWLLKHTVDKAVFSTSCYSCWHYISFPPSLTITSTNCSK